MGNGRGAVLRLTMVAVGRLRAGPIRDLVTEFSGRMVWPLAMREVEEKRPLPVDALRREEGLRLLAAVPDGATLVALDERGTALSSEALAARLGGWQDGGRNEVAFVIGGANGLDETVRKRAELVLTLGVMTWPHLLVRAMLLEQLYRAQQILAGHPYHRS